MVQKIKVGIVGHGFVGKATDYAFSKNVEKFIVDPIYETSISDLAKFDPEFVFICVPTPMGSKGTLDSSIVEEVISEIEDTSINATVIIKSTILPDILSKLLIGKKNYLYNPEFLREKFANEDFINAEMIIIGGDKLASEKLAKLYKENSLCVNDDYIFTDAASASLIKYSINTFLATKVLFFNQINNIFSHIDSGLNWESFINILKRDQRIGSSHMDVPGHDGKLGFGGACFPKDTAALLNYTKKHGINFSILEEVIRSNNEIRSKYGKIDEREKDQNISFE